ncbi:hypothetical protein MJL48_31760, partial [Salmonella enterica subsp. enterica serovar Kentucky]|nr:hypothetical protein [Salmonella enterica subsp. enterica serovar Kentucky]
MRRRFLTVAHSSTAACLYAPSPAGEALVSRLRALGQVAWSFPLIEFVAGRELPTLADRLAT